MKDKTSPENNWAFREDDAPQSAPQTSEVTWTASEYIAHQKGLGWYLLLVFATTLLAVFVYLIARDVLTVVAIAVVAGGFGFLASKSPRTLHYSVGASGVMIGDKLYPHTILRSFSIQEEGGLHSVLLIPLKRFMPTISLYYPPDQEDEVLAALSNYIPHEERRPDMVDRLMRRVRF